MDDKLFMCLDKHWMNWIMEDKQKFLNYHEPHECLEVPSYSSYIDITGKCRNKTSGTCNTVSGKYFTIPTERSNCLFMVHRFSLLVCFSQGFNWFGSRMMCYLSDATFIDDIDWFCKTIKENHNDGIVDEFLDWIAQILNVHFNKLLSPSNFEWALANSLINGEFFLSGTSQESK